MTQTNWTNFNFKQYIVADQLMYNLPKGVSISTMCAKCKLGTELNIDLIKYHLPLNKDDILTVKINTENMRTLIEEKKKKRRTKRKAKIASNPFYNQITVVIRINEGDYTNMHEEPKINLKLFKNGSIQISGLKNIEYTNRALNKLIHCLSQVKGKMIDNKITDIQFVENISKMNITDFEIYMINSNYMVNLMIDRTKLYSLLLMKKIKASYEKCVRACVNIKYTPPTNNNEEKDVSVFIFEKGNIIITGARNFNHVISTYEYINNILLSHIDEIIKKDDILEGKMILKFYEDIYTENKHKFEDFSIPTL
jgi:TATA-box binding protein (TBP) (component of TFIID and TFIIIB)